MASAAKGGFLGKPRKRIHKKAVKFRKKLQKLGVKDVMRMCSFLNEANDQFENIFDDDNDQVSMSDQSEHFTKNNAAVIGW